MNQKERLQIELQAVNLQIEESAYHRQLYTEAQIGELLDRKETLEFLINDPIANPYYCFCKL